MTYARLSIEMYIGEMIEKIYIFFQCKEHDYFGIGILLYRIKNQGMQYDHDKNNWLGIYLLFH